MKELSRITETFSESLIREMTRICISHKGINLAQGFPDFETPERLKEAAIKAIREGKNQYAITHGEPELREAICKRALAYNGMKVDPASEITVTVGATEAMLVTLKAIINPGDEALIFEPFYENYGPDAILSGATPRYVKLYPPDWRYKPDELAAAFNEKTKVIIINTPNNPTGKVFSKDELLEISDLCRKWDCYVATDEIYEHILFDGKKHVSIASLPDMAERTITINAISKTYSATGWRVGWAIARKEITARIRKVHDFVAIGAPMPLQHASVTALGFEEEYYAKLASYYQDARDFMLDVLAKTGFKFTPPKGAYYVLTDVTNLMNKLGAKNDVEFAIRLVKDFGVATVPCSPFYSNPASGANLVRFCFCKKMETLKAAAKALEKLRQI